jgi:replicative DNA helicase
MDAIIGGYKKRRLYIVGGRPSMGKTSLMIEAAIQHCARGVRTRLISLEMEAEELLQRIYAAAAEVAYERLTTPASLDKVEWQRVEFARKIVAEWPLEIDSRADQDIDGALARARLSCRRRKTGFLAADYAQIFHFKEEGKLRHQEISDIGKKLRNFAKTEDIPVMLLSSLTETGDRNPNQRPTLASLRGSGDLAFHADVAILIHRERDEDGAAIKTDSELIVVKQRGGRTGVCYATYNTNSLLFEDRN